MHVSFLRIKWYYIELTSDIDLEGYDWKPIISLSNKTINGNGHTIRNMTITDNELTDIGFIGTASNCTVKDITLQMKKVNILLMRLQVR
ncbi:MAG: hypothetical protein PUE12_13270 [Oscillospiraceae bacterium]|nr:hypothetical protein [Oscillospiraceae bacterium]